MVAKRKAEKTPSPGPLPEPPTPYEQLTVRLDALQFQIAGIDLSRFTGHLDDIDNRIAKLADVVAKLPAATSIDTEALFTKLYTAVATDLVGKLDERITKLTTELGAQVNSVVQQKTDAIGQALATQITTVRDGLATKIDERMAQLGVAAKIEGTATTAPEVSGDGKAVNPFFEIGKGIVSGLADSIGKFEPILKLIIPQKQPDMGMLIDNYTRLHRYEAAGGNIDELKKIVTGQP
jgi:hypothetical protein